MVVITPLLILLFVFRLTRWLAWLQQKEYRWDRLWLWMKTPEGVKEFFWPFPFDYAQGFQPSFKRPRPTLRIILVGVTVIVIGILWSDWWLVWLATPLWVLVASLPYSLARTLLTNVLLFLAQRKISRIQPTIIGITGSYGKSSTKTLLVHLLQTKQPVFSPTDSHNTPLSIALDILKHYRNQRLVIIEFAAYKKGEIARLARLFKPSMAVITGVTFQHAGLFGSVEDIMKAKTELLAALPNDGCIVANALDERVVDMVRPFEQRVLWFGNGESFSKTRVDEDGRVTFFWKSNQVHTQLVGLHYLANVAAAFEVCQEFGMTDGELLTGMRSFQPSQKFIQTRRIPQGSLVIDDGGTANPKGFFAAIDLVESLGIKNNILVFGGIVDLGHDSDRIHQEMAQRAVQVFDTVFYVGDVGKVWFRKEFGKKLVNTWVNTTLNDQTVILIEGRVRANVLSF